MDKHLEVAVCHFHLLESSENMFLLLQPLWEFTVLSLVKSKGTRMMVSVMMIGLESPELGNDLGVESGFVESPLSPSLV